ncbi:MAG: hypothetical protein ACHQ4H_18260 [Ktedonobacterales bacterium]
MLRRVELGAGIACGLLALAGLAALLLAPVPYCAVNAAAHCPAADVRYTTLPRLQLPATFWIFLAVEVVVLLAAAAGAIAEVRFGRTAGAGALWADTVIGFMGCAFTATGAGIFFLPAVLAAGLSGYASLLRRIRARQAARRPTATS